VLPVAPAPEHLHLLSGRVDLLHEHVLRLPRQAVPGRLVLRKLRGPVLHGGRKLLLRAEPQRQGVLQRRHRVLLHRPLGRRLLPKRLALLPGWELPLAQRDLQLNGAPHPSIAPPGAYAKPRAWLRFLTLGSERS
jgi:hypothetical protein